MPTKKDRRTTDGELDGWAHAQRLQPRVRVESAETLHSRGGGQLLTRFLDSRLVFPFLAQLAALESPLESGLSSFHRSSVRPCCRSRVLFGFPTQAQLNSTRQLIHTVHTPRDDKDSRAPRHRSTTTWYNAAVQATHFVQTKLSSQAQGSCKPTCQEAQGKCLQHKQVCQSKKSRNLSPSCRHKT